MWRYSIWWFKTQTLKAKYSLTSALGIIILRKLIWDTYRHSEYFGVDNWHMYPSFILTFFQKISSSQLFISPIAWLEIKSFWAWSKIVIFSIFMVQLYQTTCWQINPFLSSLGSHWSSFNSWTSPKTYLLQRVWRLWSIEPTKTWKFLICQRIW
jgi:hypothetical protein